MTVDVVVLAFGQVDKTARCLDALAASDYPQIHLILVDNSSGHRHQELLKNYSRPWTLIKTERNLGFAEANNRAAREGKADAILLLNNDCYIKPDCLSRMVECLEADEQAAIVGALLLYPNGTIQHAGMSFSDGFRPYHPYRCMATSYLPDLLRTRRQEPAVTGACLLVKRTAWQELAGLDETFDPMYYEDIDLCVRARAAGYHVWYEGAAEGIHEEGGSTSLPGAHSRADAGPANEQRFISRWVWIYRDLNSLTPR